MTWWEWLAVAIWGPTTLIGVIMIASLPTSALWRRLRDGAAAATAETIRATEPARAIGEQVA
jgi:hypothetical protein